MKWRNAISAIIGIWFIVAPWALNFSNHAAAVWTSVILGLIQLGSSAWSTFDEEANGWKTWQPWVTCVMGLWFVVQPFVFHLTANTATVWSSVILGIITIALNLWNMYEHNASSAHKSSASKATT